MEIDGIAVEIEWDPDEDRFYGVAEVPGVWNLQGGITR